MLPARLLMTPLMLPPSVVKTPTTARAMRAAATAYSESSRPVSSRRKLLIMVGLLLFLKLVSRLCVKALSPGLRTQSAARGRLKTSATEVHRRSLTRARRAPSGDRLLARLDLRARAACVEHLECRGHGCERQHQEVLPRVRRHLDGAQADEDGEGEERGGQREGGEREA